MRRLLELNHSEARQYLLKAESYFSIDLPQYFVFQNLLNQVSAQLNGHRLSDFLGSANNAAGLPKATYPCNFENVNYTFLNNKDGKFAWRL